MKGCTDFAISDLFSQVAAQSHNHHFTVEVSFFEIYSGKVFDLLPGSGSGGEGQSRVMLQLLEDGKQRIQVQGL